MASPYSLHELKEGEIRVLDLLPGKVDQPIVVHLRPALLTPSLDYDALSYVWGTTISPVKILVEDVHMSITENLDSALRHLRGETSPRTIWIDALCINQSNIPERNHQVGMMSQIYSMAKRVLIWLGPETPDDHVSSIISRGEDVSAKDFRWVLALCKLAHRPWFSRVWVAQEFALSHNDPVVFVGLQSISWSQFKQRFIAAEMTQMLNDAPYEVEAAVDESSKRIDRVEDTRATLRNFRQDNANSTRDVRNRIEPAVSKKAHFAFQLIRTATLEATDPRDKIYGLLGMSGFETHRIQADYSKPPEQVFAEAASVLLQERHVEFYMYFPLRCTRVIKPTANTALHLPSWVPNFVFASASTNIPLGAIPLNSVTRIRQAYHRPDTLIEPPSDAEPEAFLHKLCTELPVTTPPILISSDNRILQTYGKPLGSITHVLSRTPEDLSWRNALASGPAHIRHFYRTVLQPQKISAKDFLVAILPPAMRDPELYEDLVGMTEELLNIDDGATDPAPDVPEDFLDGLCQLSMLSTNERTLFVTDTSKIGLAYHHEADGIKAGDEVAGLFGIGFVFVLRKITATTTAPVPSTRDSAHQYEMINVAYLVNHKWGHEEFGNVTWKKYGKDSKEHKDALVEKDSFDEVNPRRAWTWDELQECGIRRYTIV